jgi:hypothetical protein
MLRRVLTRLRPSPALAVAFAALAVALGGVAYATIPNNGVIHGCYTTAGQNGGNNPPGMLRVVDTGVSCTPSAKAISFAATDDKNRVMDSEQLGGIAASSYQQRVTSSCVVGSAIRAINQDGTVDCQTGTTGTIGYTSTGSGRLSTLNIGFMPLDGNALAEDVSVNPTPPGPANVVAQIFPTDQTVTGISLSVTPAGDVAAGTTVTATLYTAPANTSTFTASSVETTPISLTTSGSTLTSSSSANFSVAAGTRGVIVITMTNASTVAQDYNNISVSLTAN